MNDDQIGEGTKYRLGVKGILKRIPTWIKISAILILFGIPSVAGALSFADYSHKFAILAGGLVSVALLYVEGLSKGLLRIGHFLLLSAMVVAVCGYFFFRFGENLPVETNIHGWLVPDQIETPLLNCPAAESDAILIMGTSAYVTNYPGKFPVFNLGTCAPLHIQKTGDGMAVDFDMYSPQKNLISRLFNNEWHLVPTEYSYEQHPDRSTLQVFDKQGDELFFIRYLNRRVIWVRGAFSCGSQTPIVVDNDSISTSAGNFIMGNLVRIDPKSNAAVTLRITHACVTSHFGSQVLDLEKQRSSPFEQAFGRIRSWFETGFE
jgi:hypothetical protein